MARRTSNKIEPAQMTLSFAGLSVLPGATQTFYCDLSQVASLVNRRFYRQGLNWATAGFKILSEANQGFVTISKLPNTWVMSNAWEKGMRAWLKMNREALAETESVRPRFMDYKIHADEAHYDAGFGANMLPLDAGFAPYTAGEWEPSKMVIPFGPASPGNTNEVVIKAVGANYNGGNDGVVGLIAGYANSRALPQQLDPNAPTDSDDAAGSTPENWLAATFNEGTDQIAEVIENNLLENNQAPYPFEGDGTHVDTMYPGGETQAPNLALHDWSYITNTTLGGHTRLKGGNFPCGLIRFDFTNNTEIGQTFGLTIDLVPGHHRGYLCEPMTEM
ncbi:MAG: hypothetical protein [Circular genetic element sp.]|nr:MAG: hypothetical protein [Circular genetic element sp.]